MNGSKILGFALAGIASYVAVEWARSSGIIAPLLPRDDERRRL